VSLFALGIRKTDLVYHSPARPPLQHSKKGKDENDLFFDRRAILHGARDRKEVQRQKYKRLAFLERRFFMIAVPSGGTHGD
jgi:hypothetical protein